MTMLRPIAQKCRAQIHIENPRDPRSLDVPHVLIVGPEQFGDPIHDALFDGLSSRIFATRDYRKLWLLSEEEPFRLAVLHLALSTFDLESASRIIRRRLPGARILVILGGEDFLDGALYDHRMVPPVAAGTLLNAVRRLLNERYV